MLEHPSTLVRGGRPVTQSASGTLPAVRQGGAVFEDGRSGTVAARARVDPDEAGSRRRLPNHPASAASTALRTALDGPPCSCRWPSSPCSSSSSSSVRTRPRPVPPCRRSLRFLRPPPPRRARPPAPRPTTVVPPPPTSDLPTSTIQPQPPTTTIRFRHRPRQRHRHPMTAPRRRATRWGAIRRAARCPMVPGAG